MCALIFHLKMNDRFHYENKSYCCNDVYSLAIKGIISSHTFLYYHDVVRSIIQSAKTHSCVYYNDLVSAASFGSQGSLCK